MNIKELILELETIEKQHGNLKVVLHCEEGDGYRTIVVNTFIVCYDKDTNTVTIQDAG